jgi:hypothetical protein
LRSRPLDTPGSGAPVISTLGATMLLVEPSELEKIERAVSVTYPPSFTQLQHELGRLLQTTGFARNFPKIEAISTLQQVEGSYRAGLPKYYLPFLACQNSTGCDYYAFDVSSAKPEHDVVVFSDHAVVADWKGFVTFLAWAQSECAKFPNGT